MWFARLAFNGGLAILGLLLLVLPFVLTVRARGAERLAGPIAARVIRVIDGDTFEAQAQIWFGQHVVTSVRLSGVDAPEISRRRAKCPAEIAKGLEAMNLVKELIAGRTVLLYDLETDKYGGRVDARVEIRPGSDLGEELLSRGLATKYGAPKHWCAH